MSTNHVVDYICMWNRLTRISHTAQIDTGKMCNDPGRVQRVKTRKARTLRDISGKPIQNNLNTLREFSLQAASNYTVGDGDVLLRQSPAEKRVSYWFIFIRIVLFFFVYFFLPANTSTTTTTTCLQSNTLRNASVRDRGACVPTPVHAVLWSLGLCFLPSFIAFYSFTVSVDLPKYIRIV